MNKWTLTALTLLVVVIAVYMYSKRWKKFSDNGQAGQLYVNLTGDVDNPGTGGGGLLGFMSNGAHGLKVGDKIEIKQAAGAKYPQYDGPTTVSHIISSEIFAIEKGFAGNSPVNPGQFRKI